MTQKQQGKTRVKKSFVSNIIRDCSTSNPAVVEDLQARIRKGEVIVTNG